MAGEVKTKVGAVSAPAAGGTAAQAPNAGTTDPWYLVSNVVGPKEDLEAKDKKDPSITYTVVKNSFSSFKFCGVSGGIANGVCNISNCPSCEKSYLEILKTAQKDLIEQWKTESGFTGDVNKETAAQGPFRKWCQCDSIGGHKDPTSGKSRHFSGHAIDINYPGTPYIPMRPSAGTEMKGDQNDKGLNKIGDRAWNVARTIYDRAMQLFYGTTVPNELIARVDGEYKNFDKSYSNLQRLHWSLRFYFSYLYGFAHLDYTTTNKDIENHQTATVANPFTVENDKAKECLRAMVKDLNEEKLHPNAKVVLDLDKELKDTFKNVPTEITIASCKDLETTDPAKFQEHALLIALQIAQDHDYLRPSMCKGTLSDKDKTSKGSKGFSASSGWRDPCFGILNISYDVIKAIFKQTYKHEGKETHPRWAMWGDGADIMHLDVGAGSGGSGPAALDVMKTVQSLNGMDMVSMLKALKKYSLAQLEGLQGDYSQEVINSYGTRVHIAIVTIISVLKKTTVKDRDGITHHPDYIELPQDQRNTINEELWSKAERQEAQKPKPKDPAASAGAEKPKDPAVIDDEALQYIDSKEYDTFWATVHYRETKHLIGTLSSMSREDLQSAINAYKGNYGTRPNVFAQCVLDRGRGMDARIFTDDEYRDWLSQLPKDQRSTLRKTVGVIQEEEEELLP